MLVVVMLAATTIVRMDVVELPTDTATPDLTGTTIIERTAIARMTAQPEYASSMTPYYGDILFNEVLRQITVTPTRDPDADCWLVADFWQQQEFAETIVNDLVERDSVVFTDTVSMDVFVTVIWNTEQCDEYLPISNRLRFTIETEILPVVEMINTIIIPIFEVVVENVDDTEDVSDAESNVDIYISFEYTQGGSDGIYANLATVREVVEGGLTGDDVAEVIGDIYLRGDS
ncbi:MAG: hypothetical protein AAFU54_20520 [Chloroflexota bacterium]